MLRPSDVGATQCFVLLYSYRAEMAVQIPKNMKGTARKPRLADHKNHGKMMIKGASEGSRKTHCRNPRKGISSVLKSTHSIIVISRIPPPLGVVQTLLCGGTAGSAIGDYMVRLESGMLTVGGQGCALQRFGRPIRCPLSRKPMADLYPSCRPAGQTPIRRNQGVQMKWSFGIWLKRPRA